MKTDITRRDKISLKFFDRIFACIFPATNVFFVLLCFMYLLFCPGISSGSSGWRLEIVPVAAVDHSPVVVGDIARVSGQITPEMWQELAAMPLWPAPSEHGRPFTISRDKLEKLLRQYMGELAFKCVVRGKLILQRGGRLVDQFELERGLKQSLRAGLSGLNGEISLRDYHLPAYVLLSSSENKLVYSPPPGQVRAGRVTVAIHEQNTKGRRLRKYTGSVFVDQWVTVACAARKISIRETVTPESVTFKRKNAALLRGQVWDGKLFGLRAMRSINTGEVLYMSSLAALPVISKGDVVDLVFKGQFIQLKATAQAMTDGQSGDKIIVRNLHTKREVSAQVIDSNTVITR